MIIVLLVKMFKGNKNNYVDDKLIMLDFTGKNILELLYNISKENNKLVIVVTHNQAIKDMADKVISIKNGRVEKIEINKNPKPISEIEW